MVGRLSCLTTLGCRIVAVLKATHNFHSTNMSAVNLTALNVSTIAEAEAIMHPQYSSELSLSRYIAICMLFMYFALLLFQLKTHTHLFEGQEDDEDEDPPILGLWGAIVWITVITVFIALLSEFIVDAIEVRLTGMGAARGGRGNPGRAWGCMHS